MITVNTHNKNFAYHLDQLEVGDSFYIRKEHYGFFYVALSKFKSKEKKFKHAPAIDNKEMMVTWRVK